MITLKTYCGREIYFSDTDQELVNQHRYIYDAQHRRYVAVNNINGKRITVAVMLFGHDLTKALIFKNEKINDYQRENLLRVSKSEFYRYRGPLEGKKYKGLNHCKIRGLCVEVCIKENKFIRLIMHWNDERYAAGIYNAMCDYIGYPGYRNNVPKIELTKDQKEYIDRRLREVAL